MTNTDSDKAAYKIKKKKKKPVQVSEVLSQPTNKVCSYITKGLNQNTNFKERLLLL